MWAICFDDIDNQFAVFCLFLDCKLILILFVGAVKAGINQVLDIFLATLYNFVHGTTWLAWGDYVMWKTKRKICDFEWMFIYALMEDINMFLELWID